MLQSNSAIMFIRQEVVIDPTFEVQTRSVEIYDNYRAWCRKNSHDCMNNTHFGRALKYVLPRTIKKLRLREDGLRNESVYFGITYDNNPKELENEK